MGKGEIIVGFQNNNAPMTFNDEYGDLSGFDIELAQYIFSKIGIDVVFKEIEWDEKETKLSDNEIDCVWSSLTMTEERRKIFEFSRAYLNNKQVILIKKYNAENFIDLESLSNAKIAAGISTTAENTIKNDTHLSQAEYVPFNSQKEAIEALISKKVDAIIVDYIFAKDYLLNTKYELMIMDGIDIQEQYAVGFRKGSDMAKKVDGVLLDMMLDNSIATLSKEYDLFDCYSPVEITDSEYIMGNGKMIIGLYGSLPPMSYYKDNGELTGFDIEFAKALCQRLDLEPEFKVIFWNKKELELKKRNIDCIWNGLSVTEERRNNMKFTHVYMSNKQIIMIRKSDESKYSNLENLSSGKVSYLTESPGEAAIRGDSNLSRAELIGYAVIDDAILALKNNEIDAVVIDYTVAQENIVGGNHDLMILDKLNYDKETYAIGFRVGSDMTLLVNEQINNMINDGSLEEISKKYNIYDLYSEAVTPDENSDLINVKSRGQIIFGVDTNSPPLSYYNEKGELTGYTIDIAHDICSVFGIDAIFKSVDWKDKETELNNKNVDCILNPMAITEERRQLYDFSRSYINNEQVIVIKTSNASKYKGVQDLSKAKLTAAQATTGEEAIKENAQLSKANYSASSTQNEAIQSLKKGDVDAIVIDYVLAKGIIDNGNDDLMIIKGISLREEQLAIGFRVGSDLLLKINNIILDKIMDDTLSDYTKNYDLFDHFESLKVTDASNILGSGKMVIGVKKDFPPMSFIHGTGELLGFDVEFAREVCQRLGIEAEFKFINWEERETNLNERTIDCIWCGLSVTDESRELMKFSRVYLGNKYVLVIKKSDASRYTDIKSFTEGRLSAEFGGVGEQIIKSNQFLRRAEYNPSNTSKESITALENNEFDAVVVEYTIAIFCIDIGSEVMILEEFDTKQETYAIGFRKDSDITIHINKIINNMISDGTLTSIAEQYSLVDLLNMKIKVDSKSDLDYIMSKGEMIVGVETDRPPTTYYDEYGELTGFDTDFAKAVGSKLGIDVIFKTIIWSEKEKNLDDKDIDCIWNTLTVTQERYNYFSFSHIYLSNRPVLVIRKEDADMFTDAQSFTGKRLTAQFATSCEDALLNSEDLSEVQYTYAPSNSQDESLILVRNGTHDATLIDFTTAQYNIDHYYNDLTIYKGIRFPADEYAVGFRLKSDMTNKVNTLILDMILDGSLTTLSKKYGIFDLYKPVKITDSSYIMKNGKMIIGFDSTLAPMSYYDENNQLTGFDIDFAKLVCQKLGITAEFKSIDWDEKESELKNRNIDCIWGGLSVTEERRENIKFSRIYMSNRQVIAIKKSNVLKFSTIDSFSQAKLVSKFGTLGEEAIKLYIPSAEYVGYSAIEELFVAVQKTTADALVTDYSMAKYYINSGGFKDLIILESIQLGEDYYAVGFRHGSDMTTVVNEIIKNMTDSDALQEIASKYDLLNLYSSQKSSKIIGIVSCLLILYTLFIIIL